VLIRKNLDKTTDGELICYSPLVCMEALSHDTLCNETWSALAPASLLVLQVFCRCREGGMLQACCRRAAVWCSVLQSVAVCCSVLQCLAEQRHTQAMTIELSWSQPLVWYCSVCCSVLRCVVVCCGMWHCVAVCCSVWKCVAWRCSVLQCVAVCCSVL